MMGDAAEARFEADLAKAIALSLQTEARDGERRRTSGAATISLPPGKSCHSEHSSEQLSGVLLCVISVVCQLLDTLSGVWCLNCSYLCIVHKTRGEFYKDTESIPQRTISLIIH